MATITVSISDKTNDLFRKTVEKELGKGKGKLGKALDDAITSWANEKLQKKLEEELMNKMEKGFNLGKILYKKRSELYERDSSD